MDVEQLRSEVKRGKWPKFVFFWGHQAKRAGAIGPECLSQWYPAPFTLDGVRYPTAEHYMMAEKARLFDDADALAKVLASPSPAVAKRAGRSVRRFDEAAWAAARFDIVVRGNLGKFGQHPPLAEYLVRTKQRVLVEASPRDRIWGIGLAKDDPRAENPLEWRGRNELGFALMEVRSRLA